MGVKRTLTVSLCFFAAACGSKTSEPPPPVQTDLVIQISSPEDGAGSISVTDPILAAALNRALDQPDRMVVELVEGGGLFSEGVRYHGVIDYSATNLEVRYSPFNILRGGRDFSFAVKAEGAEASVAFTTETPFAGEVPNVIGQTFDLRLKSIVHPEEISEVFNAQLDSAPPVLLHVVRVEPDAADPGLASVLVVTSAGRLGDPMGQTQVLPENDTHRTTTAVAIEGIVEGRWLGAGPFDLHTTASGVPLVIRDLFVTGVVGEDTLDQVGMTGVIDPEELGRALELDLDSLCTDEPLRKYCDEDKRIRVAAEVETASNSEMPFTTFITSPINASEGVDPTTDIAVQFSEPIDQAQTQVILTDDAGGVIAGSVTAEEKLLHFTPSSLSSGVHYSLEVRGVSQTGAMDVRHIGFTTR